MNGPLVPVLWRVTLVVLVAVGGFLVSHARVRQLETQASVALVRLTGERGVFVTPGASIQVVPRGHLPFRAVVTPTCSSTSSLLAIGCLASLTPRRGRRRIVAAAVATGAVLLGNVVRIAGSVLVGLAAGRSSLVLFHDWVGSIFAFGYTLGGYILLLFLLLPRRQTNLEGPSWHLSRINSSLSPLVSSSSRSR